MRRSGPAFACAVGAEVAVLVAGIFFGLPCPADLGDGVLAGLGSFGDCGVPPGAGIVTVAAGCGDGGFGLLADHGDLFLCLAEGCLCAGLGSVGVGAGAVGCFQRRRGVTAGCVHRCGGGSRVLDGCGGLGLGDGGPGLGLAAGGVRRGQRRGDSAGLGGGQLGGRGARHLGGLGQEFPQPGEYAAGCGGVLPGRGGGGTAAVVFMPLA
jgi:hypothetical protein